MDFNCEKCNDSGLADFAFKIKCDYHRNRGGVFMLVCRDCNKNICQKSRTIIDYDWKSALINTYDVNARHLDYSDITYYKKCSLYSIVKINDITKIICNDCMENALDYYIPWRLQKCSMCNLDFNPTKIDEILCYGKCERILDVCKDCHKNIMVDYQHFGLGIYEVCMECIDDYHKFMNDNPPPIPSRWDGDKWVNDQLNIKTRDGKRRWNGERWVDSETDNYLKVYDNKL